MNTLLEQFAAQILTFNFLWAVVASTITMEVLKWNIAYLANTKSKYYPLWTLIICSFWVIVKTAFAGSWQDVVSNLVFTAILADVVYTYLGQYIIKWILGLFGKQIGTPPDPPKV